MMNSNVSQMVIRVDSGAAPVARTWFGFQSPNTCIRFKIKTYDLCLSLQNALAVVHNSNPRQKRLLVLDSTTCASYTVELGIDRGTFFNVGRPRAWLATSIITKHE